MTTAVFLFRSSSISLLIVSIAITRLLVRRDVHWGDVERHVDNFWGANAMARAISKWQWQCSYKSVVSDFLFYLCQSCGIQSFKIF